MPLVYLTVWPLEQQHCCHTGACARGPARPPESETYLSTHVQQTDTHGKAGTALAWCEVPLMLRTNIFSQKFTLPLLGAFQSLAAWECQAPAKALMVFSRVKQALLNPGSHRGSREKRPGAVVGAASPSP